MRHSHFLLQCRQVQSTVGGFKVHLLLHAHAHAGYRFALAGYTSYPVICTVTLSYLVILCSCITMLPVRTSQTWLRETLKLGHVLNNAHHSLHVGIVSIFLGIVSQPKQKRKLWSSESMKAAVESVKGGKGL